MGLEADVKSKAAVSQPVSKSSDQPDPGRGAGAGKSWERRRGSSKGRSGGKEGLGRSHIPKGNAQ